MCLIIAKSAGVKMPSYKVLKRAFDNNSDGFGMAYRVAGGMPHIRKGAMTFKAIKHLIRGIPNPIAADIVFHFRFATHGHIWEGNCHPFPLSRSTQHLTALDITSRMAIAHNGIIFSNSSALNTAYYGNWNAWDDKIDKTDNLSDTQEFIRDYLVDIGDAIFNKGVRKLIEDDTMSKFAILTMKGILLIGDFSSDKGLYFSNDSYKKPDYYAPMNVAPKVSTFNGNDIPLAKKVGNMFKCDLCNVIVDIVHLYQGCWLCDKCHKDTVETWENGYE